MNSGDAAERGDLEAADRSLEQIGNALAAFDYPRVLLKKKIERLYRELDTPGEGPERGLLRALLDAEVVRLPRALASREGRRDLWREVSRIEEQARKQR